MNENETTALIRLKAEAIEIANDTEFGLIAYVSSVDPERANRVGA